MQGQPLMEQEQAPILHPRSKITNKLPRPGAEIRMIGLEPVRSAWYGRWQVCRYLPHVLTCKFWSGGPTEMILYCPESAAHFPQLENISDPLEAQKTDVNAEIRTKKSEKVSWLDPRSNPGPLTSLTSALPICHRAKLQIRKTIVD